MFNEFKQYRIGVLAGGPSSEREISLKSGKAVLNALTKSGFTAVFLDVNEKNFASAVADAGIDLAFIALHGRFGEDGTVQRMLEEIGLPYTGSGPEASRLAMDKILSKEAFAGAGLNVAGHAIVTDKSRISDIEDRVPCVVKPRYEGSSVGLSVVHTRDALKKSVLKARAFGEDVIVEDFIPGRELTVGVLDGAALPVVEIVPAEGVYDYAAKYNSSDTKYVCPANVAEDEYQRAQEAALAAHGTLGCRGFSRVDMRLTEAGDVFMLEVNTIPGLTERSLLPMAAKTAGLDFPGLCVKMLRSAVAGC